jgi:predicted DNA-binding mobile mystery protein A
MVTVSSVGLPGLLARSSDKQRAHGGQPTALKGYNRLRSAFLTCYYYSNMILLSGYNRSTIMNLHLASRQLDETLGPWRQLPGATPASGWLRAIRLALGLTTRQLAVRVGVSQSAVVDVEGSEARGDVTLATLQRYADALNCDVRYVLVPRQPLQDMLHRRADEVARQQVERVEHSMALEGQSTSTEFREAEVARLRAKLLDDKPSRLWK